MDAFLLLAAVSDGRCALVGGTVQDVRPAGPHGLWFELATTSGQDSFLVTADEVLPRIARGARRPAKGGAPTPLAAVAQRVLSGSRLLRIDQHGLDRVVSFGFAHSEHPETAGRLVAELFGHQPNVILLDATSGQIREAGRHVSTREGRAVGPGLPYLPPPAAARPDPLLLGTSDTLGAVLAPALTAGMAPAVALQQHLAGLSALWAQEVAALAGGGSATELARTLLDLLRRVAAGPWEPHLVLGETGVPMAAAPIRLCHLPAVAQQPCASLGEAVARLARARALCRELADRQAALRQVLHRLEGRLESRRKKLATEAETFARADTWQRMGEILVAHQREVPRGATEVLLPDHASGVGATLAISLDPALPPAANAERFFKLTRRGRRGAVRVASRLAETVADLDRIQGWVTRLADARDRDTVEGIQQEVATASRLLRPQDRADLGMDGAQGEARQDGERAKGARPSRPRGARPEPRRFLSSDGLPILVGRDNEGNDYLTLHLARSEDVWLHVEGSAGSHVVIRVQGRKGGVPRRTLVQAAQLAAYYSQARDHGKVAVDYTLRKYVRKPRKSKPGLVTISQVKTIVVSSDKSLVAKLAATENITRKT
jgi:predicted ribosome quality control (RQC) complex YloA/Tae2 family protein